MLHVYMCMFMYVYIYRYIDKKDMEMCVYICIFGPTSL